ncbi:MAG: hypothetical protein HY391_03685 [Deltaproteobacteria bacterium]|nr:hypothetical protein [Deltaproteobacteria bacterium]
MSLKAFHLLFILLSTLLSLGFGVWGWFTYKTSGSTVDLAMSMAAFVAAIALIFYARYFIRKLKNISYL